MTLILEYLEDPEKPIYEGYLWATSLTLAFFAKTFFKEHCFYIQNLMATHMQNMINTSKKYNLN